MNILRRWRSSSKARSKTDGDAASKNRAEAEFFGRQDNARQRAVAWSAIPYFRQQIHAALDVGRIARQHLAGREAPTALALAAGDMTGEYGFLTGVGAERIHALDISEGQRDKFFAREPDPAVPVEYIIADVNSVVLEPERYDLVYVQQAFHHFEQLEHVADQVNRALKPGGRFVLIDYIGANFLQRTPRQRSFCTGIWRDMPARYRRNWNGTVLDELWIPDKDKLSPYEAIRAEEIMDVLNRTLQPIQVFPHAAILFPLFNGFAQNYTDSEEDQRFIREMWELDRDVVESGEVEPNFVRGVFGKRD